MKQKRKEQIINTKETGNGHSSNLTYGYGNRHDRIEYDMNREEKKAKVQHSSYRSYSETEHSHRVETEPSPKFSNIYVYSSDNEGDDKLLTMEIPSYGINNPEVDNNSSNSGLKTQRRKEQVINRT